MEFRNLQLKDKASNNSGAPLTLSLHKPGSEDQIPGIALLVDTSVTVEKQDHQNVVLDQQNNIMKKDDNIPSYSLQLGLSQLDCQSPVPQTPSVPNLSTARVIGDDGSEDGDDGAPLRFPLRNTS